MPKHAGVFTMELISSTISVIKVTPHISITIPRAPNIVSYSGGAHSKGLVLAIQRGHIRVSVNVDKTGRIVRAERFEASITGNTLIGIQAVNDAAFSQALQAFIDSSLDVELQIAERNARVEQLINEYGVTPKEARKVLWDNDWNLFDARVTLLKGIFGVSEGAIKSYLLTRYTL